MLTVGLESWIFLARFSDLWDYKNSGVLRQVKGYLRLAIKATKEEYRNNDVVDFGQRFFRYNL